MNAIDTNVLLYYVDRDELAKQTRATELLTELARSGETTLLLSQVAVEFGAGLMRWVRTGKVSSLDRDRYFQNIAAAFPLGLPKTNLVPVAFDLSQRYSLSYWDALLLAGCIDAGVDTLYSEDLTHGAHYMEVNVVNPYV